MDMELEQKQAEIIDELVRRASTCNGEALLPIIIEATSHPSLFAFSEILALPNVAQVCPNLFTSTIYYSHACLLREFVIVFLKVCCVEIVIVEVAIAA